MPVGAPARLPVLLQAIWCWQWRTRATPARTGIAPKCGTETPADCLDIPLNFRWWVLIIRVFSYNPGFYGSSVRGNGNGKERESGAGVQRRAGHERDPALVEGDLRLRGHRVCGRVGSGRRAGGDQEESAGQRCGQVRGQGPAPRVRRGLSLAFAEVRRRLRERLPAGHQRGEAFDRQVSGRCRARREGHRRRPRSHR